MKRAKKIAVIVLVFMLAISSCGLMQSSSVSAAKHRSKFAGRQAKSNALKKKLANRIKNKVSAAFGKYEAQFVCLFIGFVLGTLPSLIRTAGERSRSESVV